MPIKTMDDLLTLLEENPRAFNWHERQQIQAARSAFESGDRLDPSDERDLQELAERL